MKLTFTLLFVFVFGGVAVFPQKTYKQPPPPLIYKAPDKTELKEFTADDNSFKVTFPGVPKVSKQDMDKAMVTICRVSRQGSNSVVTVFEFKNDLEDFREKAFEFYKSSIEKQPKTTIEAERDIEVDGMPVKEFDVLEDLTFQKLRLLVSGKRLYELKNDVVNWHILKDLNNGKTTEFENETKRFFDSFKLFVKKEPVPIGFLGIINETSYVNKFFGFSFEFPENWYVEDPFDLQSKTNLGLEALKTNQEKLDRAFAEAAKKETIIFALSKDKIGDSGGGGDNFLVGVMKQPEQADSEVILKLTKDFFLKNPKFELLEDVKNVEINGTKFSTVAFETTIGDLKLYQRLYLTVRKGYSINFAMSYLNENGRKSLEKIFQSVKFNLK